MRKTKKKLKYDEANICLKMIKRFGSGDDEDNVEKMFKDIKLNYLQWSRGQITKNLKIYEELHSKNWTFN